MTDLWRCGARALMIGASLLTLPGLAGEGPRAQAADDGSLLYEGPGLRIVRGLDRQGRPVLLLTNLDDVGNRLLPAEAVDAPACAPVTPAPAAVPPAPSAPTEAERAPVIVINIENGAPPPPPQDTAEAAFLPVVAFGGLPGRFRYPDHLPFLGYGPGIASPSWLGGLGLNAGNRFGLGVGRGCGDGYDCLFAPSAARP